MAKLKLYSNISLIGSALGNLFDIRQYEDDDVSSMDLPHILFIEGTRFVGIFKKDIMEWLNGVEWSLSTTVVDSGGEWNWPSHDVYIHLPNDEYATQFKMAFC